MTRAKQGSTSFWKKKQNLVLAARALTQTKCLIEKVFWFFFAKKNRLLRLPMPPPPQSKPMR
jgi:hypothetical protein